MSDEPQEVTPAPEEARAAVFLQQTVLPVLLIVGLVVVAAIFHRDLGIPSVARSCIVLILAAALLYLANRLFFATSKSLTDPLNVRFVIAFDVVVFIVMGMAATVLACNHWEAAFLLGGACLLVGGFFGLLFGYPQGVAQQAAPSNGSVPTAATHQKNLLADSAATLGKVITGFTLAKLSSVSAHYASLCSLVGPVLGAQEPGAAGVLAGVIIAYFVATGFFAGLLLPPYFMSGQI